MINKKILLMLLVLLVVPSISAVCTLTLDKGTYTPDQTATVSATCSSNNERNQAYTIAWYNITSAGSELIIGQNDTGTTPGTVDEVFLETFIIPTDWNVTNNITVNMTGTQLEGGTSAVVALAGSSDLVISDIISRGTFLGLSSSVHFTIKDENGKKISGGSCHVDVEDPTNEQILFTGQETMSDGTADIEFVLFYQRFKEGKDYVNEISCFCGSAGSDTECIDEDGINVNGSIGSATDPFTTSTWITFFEDPFDITFHNGTDFETTPTLFAGFDEIHWDRNVSNRNPDDEPLEVRTRTILVNNDTKQIYGRVNEGRQLNFLDGFAQGNSSSIRNHLLSKTTDTGLYFIRIVFDVIYKGQFQVAQYIQSTTTFNITSIQDIFQINETEVHDFFGAEVRLNASTQSLSVAPPADNTTTYTVLTEAFNFDFCITANNTRDEDIHIYYHELVLENTVLNTSFPILGEGIAADERIQILEANSTDTEFCITDKLPNVIASHSDYRFSFVLHIGTESEEFECGEECEFTGHTDNFYVLKLTDMIEMPKFIDDPTATADGNPGIRIVTQRGEYLPMFNDINYTNQQFTDWDNGTATCLGKDDGLTQACNYTYYPRAGENFKVCFEGRSYFSDEVFVNLFDLYLDTDEGDSEFQLVNGNFFEIGIKSISDNDLYRDNAPSRKLEADGNLTDGYATYCTDWIKMPTNIAGGNSWDIQGRASLDEHLYDIEDINWDWESDEFPIYGLFTPYPEWDLHLFDPVHYRIPERWDRVNRTQYVFNLSIPQLNNNINLFDFGEHIPFTLTDFNTPLNRIADVTMTYQNGSDTGFTTDFFTQFGSLVFLIEDINLSLSTNNFTITTNLLDLAERSTSALEGIENKTGTFHLEVVCPGSANPGDLMICNIIAFVEAEQLTQKEVSFTCYIDDNGVRVDQQNFNHMINRTSQTLPRTFSIPGDFVIKDYVLQCTADYFNLGSRTDSFFDTFSVIPSPSVPESFASQGGDSGGSIAARTEDSEEPEDTSLFGLGDLIIGGLSNILDLDNDGELADDLPIIFFIILLGGSFVVGLIVTLRIMNKSEDQIDNG